MTAPALQDRREGATLNYTCSPGAFAKVNDTQPPASFIIVTCSTNSFWGVNADAVETITLPECITDK
ncbi:hypothetical protein E2C01_092150 [Portunus trituberculatus]|uniref:Sushi domain-containing protein n=1 Tax=Portunus trituberculatus TaxID=210409 RepID=A0A5B7JFS3_PORTR|nr:hypothetical protein [Portunus trituberculatus]